MNGLRSVSEREDGGHTTGYAVIAGALCLSLLATVSLAAEPVARLMGAMVLLISGQ